MIYRDVTATVGRTPMVELGRLTKGLPGRVAAKLEMRNPCGSVKDRVGVALVEDAERRGVLRPGVTLVEASAASMDAARSWWRSVFWRESEMDAVMTFTEESEVVWGGRAYRELAA